MRIELRGNADLRKALRRFAPDLDKALKKELSSALRPIVRAARGFAPTDSQVLSGWRNRSFNQGSFPTYSQSTVRNGIGFTTSPSKVNKNGYSSAVTIYNKSAAGAIYESAGRNGNQGQPWVGPSASGASKKVSRSINPKAGEQFIASMPELTGSLKGRGRLIFKAWAENRGKAEGAINKAISVAEQALYARSKSGKLGRAA